MELLLTQYDSNNELSTNTDSAIIYNENGISNVKGNKKEPDVDLYDCSNSNCKIQFRKDHKDFLILKYLDTREFSRLYTCY
jgi:hypothetical protein